MTEREPEQDPVASEPVSASPGAPEATEAEPMLRAPTALDPTGLATDEPSAPLAATADEPLSSTEGTATTVSTVEPAAARSTPQGPRPYAVIETGGKQYRVSVGDRISVEKLPTEAGDEITIDKVYLLGGDGSTRVGTPTVPGATVTAQVDEHYRGEKIVVFKYKPKKRYRRRTGHRQSLTRLTITNIAG